MLISVSPHCRLSVVLFVFTCWFSVETDAQCDPPFLLPTVECIESPLVCLQDACYTTDNNPAVGHSGFCGPMTIVHNPQYFAFIATASTVNIQVSVNSCTSGSALQSALIDTCDWNNSNVLDCDPGQGPGGTMDLVINPADSGEIYYLLIDGSNASECEYTITWVENILEFEIDEELNSIDPGALTVCQGQDVINVSVGPPIPDAAGYLWTVPWGDGFETTTNPNMNTISVPDDAPEGTFQICAVAFSGCDTTDIEQCMDLTIVAVEDEIAPPRIYCPEELAAGITWGSILLTGPDTYTQEFDTPEGCPFDSILQVDAYPEVPPETLDTVHCGSSMLYEGVTYDADGDYTLFYDNANQYGCDSSLEMTVSLLYMTLDMLEIDCENGEFMVNPVISAFNPPDADIIYSWTDAMGNQVSDEMVGIFYDAGTYYLDISLSVNGVSCTVAQDSITIDPDEFLPGLPEFIDLDSVTCSQNITTICVTEDVGITEFIWSLPDGATIFSGDGTSCLEIGWAASLGGQVCVYMRNICGDGPIACFNMTVIQEASADFVVPLTACVGDAVDVMYTGTSSPEAVFTWNWQGGTVVDGVGAGPYQVAWSTPGDKIITLKVVEPGCDTIETTQLITIIEVPRPVINCASTTNSIDFFWDPIPDISAFQVNVLAGMPGILGDTSYTISGMAAGDSVTIEIIAQDVNGCQSVPDTVKCYAQDCVPPTIEISTVDTICLNASSPTVDLSASIGGMTVNGTWSGPGIIDGDAGIFDPTDAGAGEHDISFSYVDSTGCGANQSIMIPVFDEPIAAFTIDSILCENESATLTFTGMAGAGASFDWSIDGGNIVSGSGSGPLELNWPSAGTKDISLSVSENSCTSNLALDSVILVPELSVPLISCSPFTDSVSFSWNDVQGAVSYTVNVLSGHLGTMQGNSYVVLGLTPGEVVSIELTVRSDGTCPDVVVIDSCEAQACPGVVLDVRDVPDICLYPGTGNINLEVEINGGTGSGSGSWSGPGVIDSDLGIFDPVAAGENVHNIVYTYTDEGCTFIDMIDITVDNPPQADISNTIFLIDCINNSLVLDASGSTSSNGLSFAWSASNGGVVDGGANTALATISSSGDYMVLVTDLVSGCQDSISVSVDADEDIPVADAGEDRSLDCEIVQTTLGGASSTGSNIIYAWSSPSGKIISDPAMPTITVESAGVYTIMVSDTANGCSSMDEVMVSQDTLSPLLGTDVPDTLTCDIQTVSINSSIAPVGPNYSIMWSTTNGNIISSTSSPTIEVNQQGVYLMVVTNMDNGCVDSILVDVEADEDVITEVMFEFQDPSCFGESDGSILISSITGGMPGYSYAWNSGASSAELSDLTAGTYIVTISDANGCEWIEEFTLEEPNPVTASLGQDMTVPLGVEVVAILETNVDAADIDSVVWINADPGGCTNCLSASVTASEDVQVSALIYAFGGCFASDEQLIFVLRAKEIYIPTVFSPNGDDINDYFTIFANQEIERIVSLQIYDRWGELMFEREDFQANVLEMGWNGEYGGERVLPGVYVYSAVVLRSDQREELLKGDITLVR